MNQNSWPARSSSFAGKQAYVEELIALLHRHGGMDNPPDWDAISVSRPAVNYSSAIFHKGTNDWNQFTLFDAILNFYGQMSYQMDTALPFPDLTRVVIVHPSRGSTNETRIPVNLLNRTNGIDLAGNRALEFGDVVEIPERDHALSESGTGLTYDQTMTLSEYLKGHVKLTAHGQEVELPIQRLGYAATLDEVLRNQDAWRVLLASSDLGHVEVVRHDPKTGEPHEWTFDCSNLSRLNSGNNAFMIGVNGTPLAYQWYSGGNNTPPGNVLWLCDGDVVKVPEKP
jgi:hypothetical protein